MKPNRDETRREETPVEQPDEMSHDELEEVAGGFKTSDRISVKFKLPPLVYVPKPKIPIPDPEPGW